MVRVAREEQAIRDNQPKKEVQEREKIKLVADAHLVDNSTTSSAVVTTNDD